MKLVLTRCVNAAPFNTHSQTLIICPVADKHVNSLMYANSSQTHQLTGLAVASCGNIDRAFHQLTNKSMAWISLTFPSLCLPSL